MRRAPRILMAGGGTGGHVYPAVAIADEIKRLVPDAAIEFAGTRERMEWQAVPKAGYAIHPITVSGFQRRLSKRNLAFPFRLLKGFGQSWSLVGAFDPDVVVGTGGYVSGPVLLAASLRGRPIVIQEQNAYAGVTNRLLSKRARRIHVAFREAMRYFPEGRSVLSGNPTRAELRMVDPAEARAHFEVPEQAAVLFVFGGSLGSAALNDAMEEHLEALLRLENLFVLWQTGSRYYDVVRQRVPEHARLRLMQYVDRMDLAYAVTDIALSRAGAISCSELLVTGTPSILVPSPNVAEDHQTQNARSMAAGGAAILLPESELKAGLLREVNAMLGSTSRRQEMRQAALTMARPEAATEIARDVLKIAGYNLEPNV